MSLTLHNYFAMDEWQLMDQFIAKTYGDKYIMRNREVFEWHFCQGDSQNATMMNARDGDQVIGILGYIPTQFFWGELGQPIMGAWMANWMVLEEHRTGVGALLIRRMQENFKIVAGQGAGENNRVIVAKMGFNFLKYTQRYQMVFNLKALEDFQIEFDIACISPFVYKEVAEIDTDQVYLQTQAMSPQLYAPNWEHYPSLRFGTLRDLDYINHRYLNFPFFNYQLLITGSAETPSILVFRIEETKGITQKKVARILEFIFPENKQGKKDANTLFARATLEFKQQGCVFVDYYCTAGLHKDVILSCGLKKELQGDKLPNLFNPVVAKTIDQNLEIWTDKSISEKFGWSELYVTRSDGDQDRPN
jgi:hypothetical protein